MKATKLLVALGAAMLFAACSDISSGGSSEEEVATNFELAYIRIVDGSQTLRTATPTYSLSEFSFFTLSCLEVLYLGQSIDDAVALGNTWELVGTYDGYDAIKGIIPMNAEKKYWFKLEARKREDSQNHGDVGTHKICGVTQAEIKKGIENKLSFDMYPVYDELSTDGAGEFRITVNLPDTVKSVFASLYKCKDNGTFEDDDSSDVASPSDWLQFGSSRHQWQDGRIQVPDVSADGLLQGGLCPVQHSG